MATITSTASGDWSSGATWVGGVPPGVSDLGVISAGHTVTVDTPTISAFLAKGSLVLNADFTLGALSTVGDGTGADGTLTFGPGITLALGSYNLALANCTITSNATSSSWAYVTGTGGFITSAAYTSPKQNITLSYISFQNTGALIFALKNTTGSVTNYFSSTHCTYNGVAGLFVGTNAATPVTTVIIFNYNDAREITGDISFQSYLGSNWTTRPQIKYNTFKNSSLQKEVILGRANGYDFIGNIVDGLTFGQKTLATAGDFNVQYNLFACTGYTPQAGNLFVVSEQRPASDFDQNYFYAAYANPHFVATSGGSGGTGSYSFTKNVFEVIYNTGGANCIYCGILQRNITQNILIGSGSLANNIGANTGSGIFVNRNTVYADTNTDHGQVFLTETGAYTGTIEIHSNIHYGAVTIDEMVGATVAQTVSMAGYNNHYNITDPYETATITITTDNTSNDQTVDPLFLAPSRDLAAWDLLFGSGTGTANAGIAHLLKINGYNGTTKTQSDTPVDGSVQGLVEWVTEGFTSQNALLSGAGYGGIDIGAVDVAVTYDLNATSITAGAPIVAAPSIGQIHVITSTAITTGQPVIGTPALDQVHGLTAAWITSATPSVGQPSIGQIHALTANSITTGQASISAPILAQGVHLLTADDIATSTPIIGQPYPGQIHGLIASGITTGNPSIGPPALDRAALDLPPYRTLTVPAENRTYTIRS